MGTILDPVEICTLVSPAHDWSAFFRANPELNPPGYDETVSKIAQNPYVKPKERNTEQVNDKKKKKKPGRNQTL